MKILLSIFWLNMLLPYMLFGQMDYSFKIKTFVPDTSDAKCIEQIIKATNDFASNNYELRTDTLGKTTCLILREDFGINVVDEKFVFQTCYNFKIGELVFQKFGRSVFDKSRRKADSINAAKRYMELAQGLGKKLTDTLKSHLDMYQSIELRSLAQNKQIWLLVDIDSTGTCNVVQVVDKNNNHNLENTFIMKYLQDIDLYDKSKYSLTIAPKMIWCPLFSIE